MDETIGIPLEEGVSFVFSGRFVKHRQSKIDDDTEEETNFFNLASYGNERLYRHIKSTVGRILS